MPTLPDHDPAAAWHALSAEQALQRSGVDPAVGLRPADGLLRLAQHGPNTLPQAPLRPWWRTVGRQFMSPLIGILFVAAVLAVALGHLGDAGVILAVVVVNALIGAFQEGRAEHSMAALQRLSALHVRVLRDGAEQVVEASTLVPGDIMLLAAGDAVGADARLVEQAQLQVAEAALTGESVPVSKSAGAVPQATGLADRHGMVYSGTHVTAGRARALVVATGVHTEVGRIAGLTTGTTEPKTPLERRMAQFGRALVVAAIALFVLVVLLGMWRQLPLSEVLMVAISQMVSMVPEGLPVALTVALAVGMQRMAGRGAIIRRLSAVETLGSTTVICSDKTGTLTKNEMTAVALWLPPGREITLSGIGYAPAGELQGTADEPAPCADTDPALQALLRTAALCNDAELVPPDEERTAWTVLGDPTEAALLVMARKGGIDLAALRQHSPREAELPFDADTKLMATRHHEAALPRHVMIKGAPEAVLRLCEGVGDSGIDAAIRQAAREAAEDMARRALRVLAFAELDDDPLDADASFDALRGRVRFLGLVGEIDPPREEVKLAVAVCRGAGIRPVMVTGDHKLTGMAIARELGIAQEGDRAVDGPELERMGETELTEALPHIAVFARVQPAQKLRIVQAFQARGDVVAMTGDGVNDAPALARADVGVAMGITGTDVSKEAADMVLLDDNFATIVAAVEEGRTIYDNIRKFIKYTMTSNSGEIWTMLLAPFLGMPLPLLPLQILWVNLVTDGLPGLALAVEPAERDTMRRPPYHPKENIFGRGMGRHILWVGLLMGLVSLAMGYWAWSTGHPGWQTMVFTTLTLSQMGHALAIRSGRDSLFQVGLLSNKPLLGAVLLTFILQLAVVYLPFMQEIFKTTSLPPGDLAVSLLLSTVVFWGVELEKWWLRRRAA
ncbi:MAG: HAD-IC family P-type ATPase [Rubrivivax sp.]|nr:HAD-IC family P-type ATPase [Rubrivivax sp.]